jgi:hypothetical protein
VSDFLRDPRISDEGLSLAICTPIEGRLDASLQLDARQRRLEKSIDDEQPDAQRIIADQNREDRLSNPDRSTFEAG